MDMKHQFGTEIEKELAKSELPRDWQEVMEIMSNLKRCREAYDAIGAGLWAMKLESWRDAHPEEALAIVAELNRR